MRLVKPRGKRMDELANGVSDSSSRTESSEPRFVASNLPTGSETLMDRMSLWAPAAASALCELASAPSSGTAFGVIDVGPRRACRGPTLAYTRLYPPVPGAIAFHNQADEP